MDDDDEFGDLYTDVLRPFAADSPPSAPLPHHTPPAPSSIDLNQIPRAASHSTNDAPDQIDPPDHGLTAPTQDEPPPLKKEEESADSVRVLLQPADRSSMESKPASADAAGGDVFVEGNNPMVQDQDDDVKFDIEDEDGGGSEPVIPGLSGTEGMEEGGGYDGGGGNEDWDSDSDDDLQIVLNDDNHMAMENVGVVEDGEDEVGGLVIVAGETNQGLEEQEWGENANVPTDGERKDVAEPGKAVPGPGGVPIVPKIGYGSQPHGYHPFHSQFKVGF